jgi:hypothetical protein
MDRDTFRRRLAETEEQLASGLSHIAQQCKLIVELESSGRPTDHARYLLAGLELLQATRRDSRDWLWKQLNKNTSRAKI